LNQESEGTSKNHLSRQKAIANGRIQADKAASLSPNYWIWLVLIRRSNQSWHSFALMSPVCNLYTLIDSYRYHMYRAQIFYMRHLFLFNIRWLV